MSEESVQETSNLESAVLENSAGFKLHCRRWKPTNSTPIGLVLIVHGFAEHLEYYDEIAKEMAKQSLLVFGHDHCGFGKSEGPRAFIDNFNKYSTDCLQHVALIQQEFPGIPTFILGHSMGGTIALKLVMKNASLFGGMVLVAPAVVLNPALASRTKIFVVKLLARVIPHYVVGSLEYDKITRDPKIIEYMKTDLYRWHSGMKAKFAVEFIGAMQEIYNNISNIDSPFLLLHGSNDQLVEIVGSQTLYDNASSQDKTFKIFDNAYHNLFVELEDVKNESNKMIIDWIVSHALNRPSQQVASETVLQENETLADEIARAEANNTLFGKDESKPEHFSPISADNVQLGLAFVDDDVETDEKEPAVGFVGTVPPENVENDRNVDDEPEKAKIEVVVDNKPEVVAMDKDVEAVIATTEHEEKNVEVAATLSVDDEVGQEVEEPKLDASSDTIADVLTAQNRPTSDSVMVHHEVQEVDVAKNDKAQNFAIDEMSQSDSETELHDEKSVVAEIGDEKEVSAAEEDRYDSLSGRQSPDGQSDAIHVADHNAQNIESLPAAEQ